MQPQSKVTCSVSIPSIESRCLQKAGDILCFDFAHAPDALLIERVSKFPFVSIH